jgi:hypothetical protein
MSAATVVSMGALQVSECKHCHDTIYYNGVRWQHAASHGASCRIRHGRVVGMRKEKRRILFFSVKDRVGECGTCGLKLILTGSSIKWWQDQWGRIYCQRYAEPKGSVVADESAEAEA